MRFIITLLQHVIVEADSEEEAEAHLEEMTEQLDDGIQVTMGELIEEADEKETVH